MAIMDSVGFSRMRWNALIVTFVMAGVAVAAQAPQQEAPPLPAPAPPEVSVDTGPPFSDWLTALSKEAHDRGFSEDLVSETLQGLTPLERVIQRDRSQAELNPGFDRYVSARLTPALVKRGKELLAENRSLLRRIEKDYHVQ